MAELLLGVNIDHIATLRNARGTRSTRIRFRRLSLPNRPAPTALLCICAEDRRHITDRDVRILRQTLHTA